MQRPNPTLLLLVALSACVDFRVPYDPPDLLADLPADGLAGDPSGEVDPGRPYPETFEGYDPSWCPYEQQPTLAVHASFLLDAPSFEPAGDQFASIDAVCSPPGQGGEAVFRLDTAAGTRLRARLDAPWGAVLTLAQGGCRVNHVTACSLTGLDDVLDAPRAWLFLESSGEESRPGPYRLQVALNHVDGYSPCPIERVVTSGAFEASPWRVDEGGATYREVQVVGDTTLARDRFFLPCAAGDGPDGFGGAPDHALELVGDFDDRRPRRAAVRLDTRGAWYGVLSVTGAPCGAEAEALACGAGPGGAEVRDLLLLPDVPLYAIVDGRGDDLAAGAAGGPYTLTVRIYEP